MSEIRLAQPVERVTVNHGDGGSNPSAGVEEMMNADDECGIHHSAFRIHHSLDGSRHLMVRTTGFQPENVGFNSHREHERISV